MQFDDNVPAPATKPRRPRNTRQIIWNGAVVRIRRTPDWNSRLVTPPRPTDPRDGRDNPNVHLYLKCSVCKKSTKHTSYHPCVRLAFGRYPVGDFVCARCHAHFSRLYPNAVPGPGKAARNQMRAQPKPSKHTRPLDNNIPIPD